MEVSQTVALWGANVSVGDSSASATVVVIVVVLLGLAVGLGAGRVAVEGYGSRQSFADGA